MAHPADRLSVVPRSSFGHPLVFLGYRVIWNHRGAETPRIPGGQYIQAFVPQCLCGEKRVCEIFDGSDWKGTAGFEVPKQPVPCNRPSHTLRQPRFPPILPSPRAAPVAGEKRSRKPGLDPDLGEQITPSHVVKAARSKFSRVGER